VNTHAQELGRHEQRAERYERELTILPPHHCNMVRDGKCIKLIMRDTGDAPVLPLTRDSGRSFGVSAEPSLNNRRSEWLLLVATVELVCGEDAILSWALVPPIDDALAMGDAPSSIPQFKPVRVPHTRDDVVWLSGAAELGGCGSVRSNAMVRCAVGFTPSDRTL